MHILITGAAGMIGRKLTERLASDGGLNGKPIDKLTLLDVVAPLEADELCRPSGNCCRRSFGAGQSRAGRSRAAPT